MLPEDLANSIINSIHIPIVFVNTSHDIEYMNSCACDNFRKHGNLIGKSIFDCHNEQSNEKIKIMFDRLKNGEKEILFSETDKKKIFFTAVYNSENKLTGYYERIEEL